MKRLRILTKGEAESTKQHFNGVLRAKAAADFLGIGLSTLWRWVSEKRLPQGIRLSARCTVWRLEDLENFLNQAAECGRNEILATNQGGAQ